MLIVQKYGGSSVANPERILRVAKRVVKTRRAGHRVVVVVSALGDTTDDLIKLSRRVTTAPPEREMDMLMATGEQVSVALLAMAIERFRVPAISFTGAQVGIVTDTSHMRAKILDISAGRIVEELRRGKVVVVAGFQGMTANHEITTLGRGGSDLTAVALAVALKANICEIYTDVEGVYTTDPRLVTEARKLDSISYDEMLELASLGAQVMQARSMEVAKKFEVPLHVRSSFSDRPGTIISKEVRAMEDVVVRGVAMARDQAKLTICDVPDRPGLAAKIFTGLSRANINVDMIVQNVSRTGVAGAPRSKKVPVRRTTDVSFTVDASDLQKTLTAARRVSREVRAKGVIYDDKIAKISIVGVGMRSHSGIAARMFQTLARESINIEMISTSEIKISCVIEKRQALQAVRALHKAFGLDRLGTKPQLALVR